MGILSSNRRFVALGDLVANYFYQNNNLVLINGGSSKFDCLAHLSHFGNSATAISSCPTSAIGDMLIVSLEMQEIDTSNVLQIKSFPRIYHRIYNENGICKTSNSSHSKRIPKM